MVFFFWCCCLNQHFCCGFWLASSRQWTALDLHTWKQAVQFFFLFLHRINSLLLQRHLQLQADTVSNLGHTTVLVHHHTVLILASQKSWGTMTYWGHGCQSWAVISHPVLQMRSQDYHCSFSCLCSTTVPRETAEIRTHIHERKGLKGINNWEIHSQM